MNKKSFIEVDFPIKGVSEESAREKNIRHGHISTLHIWWARKPLASSRASIYAALTPEPRDEEERLKKSQFIAQLSKWENSLNKNLIERARKDILEANGGVPPRVLDPFAGGKAIPLEALRLGCETYASDLNPVAVLIEKCTLEYPQKYGKPKKIKTDDLGGDKEINPLLEDVKKWGNWVLEEAKKEIGRFYPSDPDGSIPVGYIWARTICCQNPSCKGEIPLMSQFWLAKNAKKNVAIKMHIDKKNKQVNFKIAKDQDLDFDPSQGTAKMGTAICPICGAGIDDKTIRNEARDGRVGQRQIVVISYKQGTIAKKYRISTIEDFKLFKQAEACLDEKVKSWRWDFNPIPDEFIRTPSGLSDNGQVGTFFVHLQPVIYGMLRWGDLFNSRQKLELITFTEKVKLAYKKMISEGYSDEYAKALITYLALGIDRLVDYGSTLSILNPTGGRGVVHSMGRSSLTPLTWGYAEANPFNPAGAGWQTAMEKNIKWIEHASQVFNSPVQVFQGTATCLTYPESYFDAVITDPPYYDNVPYSDLSDFFYVWLKRVIGDLYPNLFSTPLTPKSQEIIQNSTLIRRGSLMQLSDYEKMAIKDKDLFESELSKAFAEMHRVLKNDGIAVIVFTHRSTKAWETIINSLLKSKFILTASWPIYTEKEGRLSAQKKAALASSIYMVCRKRVENKTAYFNEIKPQIEQRIKEKLDQFWNEGISGSDFFISAIGPAMEVFGKYESVEKLSGEKVDAKELLEYVRKVVSEYALSKILKSPQLSGIDEETRFYLLWRWTYNSAKVHFDDARKLAQAVGIEITEQWGNGFIKKDKEFISVLDAKERGKKFLEKENFQSMIDVLHACLLYWDQGNRKAISELLEITGNVNNNSFWQVAQAISEVLPEGDKEKQMLQGFLYGRDSYIKAEAKVDTSQKKLF